MLSTNSPCASSIVRALAAIALLAGSAEADGLAYRYQVSGTHINTGTAIDGPLHFLDDGSFIGVLNPTAPVGAHLFTGSYTELNLLFISFWSYTGTPGGPLKTGSGIKLFFGLFLVGNLEDPTTGEFSVAGIFDEAVVMARPPLEDLPSWVADRAGTTLLATQVRRPSFAIERF